MLWIKDELCVKLELCVKISIYEWNWNFKTNKEFGVNLGFPKNTIINE